MRRDEQNELKPVLIKAVVAVTVLIMCFNTFSIIHPSERGVKITFGKASEKIFTPGLQFKLPFIQKIKKYTLAPQGIKMTFDVNNSGAVSKDMQTVGTTCVVYWKYDENKIIDIVNNYTDSSLTGSLQAATLAAVKETIGTYTIYELVEQQQDVSNRIAVSLKNKVTKYPIEITQITVSNWDWPDSFDKQIAETMAKMQQVKQAQQDLLITEQKSQKQIKESAAKKQATIIDAEAALEKTKKDAEAQRIAGDALAYYNAKVAQNLSVEIKLKELENEKARIDRWDGHYVPTNNYGPIPIANGQLQGK